MNKSRFEIAYSIAVIVAVPLLLALNTLLLATNIRKDYDREIRSRAELSNSVMAATLADSIVKNDGATIQTRIDTIAKDQPELKNILVISEQEDGYRVLAGTGQDKEIGANDELQFDIVFARSQPIAKSIRAFTDEGKATRAWSVATPAVDQEGKVVGVVSSDYLTVDIEEKFTQTITQSMIVMALSAVVVFVLLIHHFRFVGYAELLRKQKEVNQTMTDFLSVATHELKAPMSIIKGYISNVSDGDYGDIPDEARKQLGVATAQTDRLNELVQDLLNVSRIEQGRLQINLEPTDIVPIVKTIVDHYQTLAKEKGMTIAYEPSQESYIVVGDAGRIQEVFTNLIDNAVKYSRQGEVVIKHEVQKKMVVTSVRDTGIGMSTEERERLFQRFYRVKNDDTKGVSGTGLGLWIIKQYIERMGGTITVDSLKNVGTEFRVSLKPTTRSAPEQAKTT